MMMTIQKSVHISTLVTLISSYDSCKLVYLGSYLAVLLPAIGSNCDSPNRHHLHLRFHFSASGACWLERALYVNGLDTL